MTVNGTDKEPVTVNETDGEPVTENGADSKPVTVSETEMGTESKKSQPETPQPEYSQPSYSEQKKETKQSPVYEQKTEAPVHSPKEENQEVTTELEQEPTDAEIRESIEMARKNVDPNNLESVLAAMEEVNALYCIVY